MNRTLGVLALLVVFGACRKGGEPPAQGNTAATGARGKPHMMRGDRASLKNYLQTVDTVRGATFDVKWTPQTVIVDRASAIRSLRSVSRDGGAIVLDAGEPKVGELKPGSVLLVWGVAVRKVTALEPGGDSVVVRTEPATLLDVIQEGTIKWPSSKGYSGGMVTRRALTPTGDLASLRRRGQGLFQFASRVVADTTEPAPEGDTAEEQEPQEGAEAEFEGEINSYAYKVVFVPTGEGADIRLDIFRSDESIESSGSKEERKELHGKAKEFGQGKRPGEEEPHVPGVKKKEEHPNKVGLPFENLTPGDLWDMQVSTLTHLKGDTPGGTLSVTGNAASLAMSQSLSGTVDINVKARMGDGPAFREKVKLLIPVEYTVPVIIGGFPFMLSLAARMIVTPVFSTRYATATTQFHIKFDGTSGITVGGMSGGKGSGDLTAAVERGPGATNSLGLMGVVVALEAPRVGFGIGLFNTSALVYADLVNQFSTVTAGVVSMVPCRRWEAHIASNVGFSTKLFGIPMMDKPILIKDGTKVWTQPEGLNCDVKGPDE